VPDDDPADKSQRRKANHHRDKVCAHSIGQRLNRRFAALCFLHHADDLRQHRVLADLRRFELEQPFLVDRCADDGISRAFGNRHGFARDHGFIQ
jgi:hypothetical protein